MAYRNIPSPCLHLLLMQGWLVLLEMANDSVPASLASLDWQIIWAYRVGEGGGGDPRPLETGWVYGSCGNHVW